MVMSEQCQESQIMECATIIIPNKGENDDDEKTAKRRPCEFDQFDAFIR